MIHRHIQECSGGHRPIKRDRRTAAGGKRGGRNRRLRNAGCEIRAANRQRMRAGTGRRHSGVAAYCLPIQGSRTAAPSVAQVGKHGGGSKLLIWLDHHLLNVCLSRVSIFAPRHCHRAATHCGSQTLNKYRII